MELKDIKLRLVSYMMQSFTIECDGTTFEVPKSQIAGIEIHKDYEEEIYPLWYVSCNIPLWLYTELTKKSDDIYVSMNLQIITGDTMEAIQRMKSGATEIAGRFRARIPSNITVADQTSQTAVEKHEGSYKKGYTFNEYAFIELTLYNAAAYNASFNKINKILSSSNLIDALTYCLNQCGISNVLLSLPDNTRSYREFKILPESGIKNILRIVEDYNFHSDGSIIFFDLSEAFIVTKKIGCDVWRNNEHKQIQFLTLAEFSETMGNFSGIYVDEKEKLTIIVINKEDIVSQDLDSAPRFTASGETQYLTVRTRNASLQKLSPNKEYLVRVDATNATAINGKYRLKTVECNMTPEGEYLSPSFTITFRRSSPKK